MKRLIQDAFSRLGYELHRKRSQFQPFVEQVSLSGVSFSFWVGDATGAEWYDPKVNSLLAEHAETARVVRPGDRVLEIGAHHGFVSMLLSQLVGERGFVLAVEPSPFNAMMTAAQIGLNRASNCQVLQAAASERPGSARISRDSNAWVTDSAESIEVPALTVDELDRRFGPFNVLKVDVEGFEYRVLAGAVELLKRRPTLLLELHPQMLPKFGSSANAVLELLAPSYRGTFVPRDDRERVHDFPGELPTDTIVNLFLLGEAAAAQKADAATAGR